MVTSERPTVVIDVAAKWAVDAGLFFAMSAGFLAWGLIDRSPTSTILTFAIMATVAILMDRLIPILPDTAALHTAYETAPDGAVRRSWRRYAASAAGVMMILGALYAALVIYFAAPGFLAGLLAGYGVTRLRALASARQVERASHVRLSVRLQRSVWRAPPPAYYATPHLGT